MEEEKISRGSEVKEDFPQGVTLLLALKGEKDGTTHISVSGGARGQGRRAPHFGGQIREGSQSLPLAMATLPYQIG